MCVQSNPPHGHLDHVPSGTQRADRILNKKSSIICIIIVTTLYEINYLYIINSITNILLIQFLIICRKTNYCKNIYRYVVQLPVIYVAHKTFTSNHYHHHCHHNHHCQGGLDIRSKNGTGANTSVILDGKWEAGECF